MSGPTSAPTEKEMRLLNQLRRWVARERPATPDIKAPVKVTVTARRIRADGTLGEEVEVKNIEVTPWPQS